MIRHGSLFSGIGGFDLAAEWMGWENVFHCEWNEFGQKVLNHYWPKAICYHDITKTDFTIHRGTIDILTGGFPCQPYSMAGKRKGKEDDRHLWPEMLRAIREIQPTWVVGENVFGLVNWSGGLVFHEVQADLEAEGYEVFPYVLPACAKNAPHRRDRIWFVAHRNDTGNTTLRGGFDGNGQTQSSERRQPQSEFSGLWNTGDATNSERIRLQKWGEAGNLSSKEGKAHEERGESSISIETISSGYGCEDVANTHSNGQHGSDSEHEINASEGGQYAQCNTQQMGKYATHPNSRRQPSKEHGQTEPEWIAEKSLPNYWENFPTQSPICSGNDGLPTELDGITFSKWRNESIKAYGNAVVPQVVYQIFKTIEAYENGKK